MSNKLSHFQFKQQIIFNITSSICSRLNQRWSGGTKIKRIVDKQLNHWAYISIRARIWTSWTCNLGIWFISACNRWKSTKHFLRWKQFPSWNGATFICEKTNSFQVATTWTNVGYVIYARGLDNLHVKSCGKIKLPSPPNASTTSRWEMFLIKMTHNILWQTIYIFICSVTPKPSAHKLRAFG